MSLTLCVVASPALASGDCSDYLDLTGLDLPITVAGSTIGAENDYGPFAEEPSCWHGTWDTSCAASRDVTYKWTAPHDGLFTVTLMGSPDNADLLLYDFTCPVEPVYPDDFICGSHRGLEDCATVREVALTTGQEILIVVDGWLIWGGEFTLRIFDNTSLSDAIAMGMDLYHYPNFAVACASSETGRWQDELGYANIAEDVHVDDDHLFRMYSTSKIVTATALMQLWEDGHFELDDTVGNYLPFPVEHPYHSEIPITFRMLMSHVAGIASNWLGLLDFQFDGPTDPPIGLCEMLEGYFTPGGPYYSAADNFTAEAPGTVWIYNSVDIALLGCLIEHINPEGLSFEEYCRAHIFDPLDMPTSAYLFANLDSDDLVTCYQWVEPEYQALPHSSAVYYPSTTLHSNAGEFSRFLLAYMQDGELYGQRILEAATIDTMLTIHYPDIPTGDYQQGLVWLRREIGGREVWGHDGSGYPIRGRTSLWFDRDVGVGVVAMTSCAGTAEFRGIHDILDVAFRRSDEWVTTGIQRPDAGISTPGLVQLDPCYPNPFNPQTTIRYEISTSGPVRLQIFDLRGRLVATLVDEVVTSGRHEIDWHGRDADGANVPSGVYLSRLEVADKVAYGRMTLIR